MWPVPMIPAVSPVGDAVERPGCPRVGDEPRVARRDDRVEERGRPRQLVAGREHDGVCGQVLTAGELDDERRRTRAAVADARRPRPDVLELRPATRRRHPPSSASRYSPNTCRGGNVVRCTRPRRPGSGRGLGQAAHRDRGHVEPVPRVGRPERHALPQRLARLDDRHRPPRAAAPQQVDRGQGARRRRRRRSTTRNVRVGSAR